MWRKSYHLSTEHILGNPGCYQVTPTPGENPCFEVTPTSVHNHENAWSQVALTPGEKQENPFYKITSNSVQNQKNPCSQVKPTLVQNPDFSQVTPIPEPKQENSCSQVTPTPVQNPYQVTPVQNHDENPCRQVTTTPDQITGNPGCFQVTPTPVQNTDQITPVPNQENSCRQVTTTPNQITGNPVFSQVTPTPVQNPDQVTPTLIQNPDQVTPTPVQNPDDVTPILIQNPDQVTPTPEQNPDQVTPVQNQDENPTRKKKKSPFLGLLYTFLASFFILQTSVMVKKLTYLHPGQLSMVRNIGVCVGCLPIAVFSSREVLGPRRHWPMLFWRSLCGATALYLNLLAYRYLPLAEASIILSTTPSVVTIFARIYLREPCGIVQVAAILLTVSGMAVSVRLPDLLSSTSSGGDHYVTGIGCALGCVLLLSINLVSLRKMLDVHYSVILLYFGVLGGLENALLTGLLTKEGFQLAACGWDTVQVALIGVLGFLGHCFFTLAVQVEAAGVASTLKSSIDIVLSMFLQVLYFQHPPDAWSVGGAVLVLLSVALIGIRKWLQTLPEGHEQRKRLKYLLM